MRFIFGLLTGLVIGAAGAVFYSVQTGRDLREEFERVRSDIQARDLDALGGRLEERLKDLQSSLEQRFADSGQASIRVVDEGKGSLGAAVDDAVEAAGSALGEAESELTEATTA